MTRQQQFSSVAQRQPATRSLLLPRCQPSMSAIVICESLLPFGPIKQTTSAFVKVAVLAWRNEINYNANLRQ